jgi:transcriptional regulator
MYVPRRYQENDREKILSFMKENSFAIVVTVREGLPVASHIPLAIERNQYGEDVLIGHISRGNDQKNSLLEGTKLLCIFPGPHAYISPRWYTQLNVPTWNYISVHAYGTLRIMEGEELKAALSRLVNTYEQQMPNPMKLEDLPEKMFNDDVRGIIGFEIKIEELQAAFKLSQNRDAESYSNVIEQLHSGDAAAKQVANAMEERKSQLFNDK